MLIRRGSSGAVVRQIQERVGAMVTGVWDTATQRKVLEFQKQNGLHQTAEVNDETYNALFPPKVKPRVKPKAVAPKPAPKKMPPKSTQIEKNETD
jgi:peptidoglycan hydrolase-like protein with peptidoglycan-binding domain